MREKKLSRMKQNESGGEEVGMDGAKTGEMSN